MNVESRAFTCVSVVESKGKRLFSLRLRIPVASISDLVHQRCITVFQRKQQQSYCLHRSIPFSVGQEGFSFTFKLTFSFSQKELQFNLLNFRNASDVHARENGRNKTYYLYDDTQGLSIWWSRFLTFDYGRNVLTIHFSSAPVHPTRGPNSRVFSFIPFLVFLCGSLNKKLKRADDDGTKAHQKKSNSNSDTIFYFIYYSNYCCCGCGGSRGGGDVKLS